MTRFLTRIVTLILVPGLIADPAVCHAASNPFILTPRGLGSFRAFESQALAAAGGTSIRAQPFVLPDPKIEDERAVAGESDKPLPPIVPHLRGGPGVVILPVRPKVRATLKEPLALPDEARARLQILLNGFLKPAAGARLTWTAPARNTDSRIMISRHDGEWVSASLDASGRWSHIQAGPASEIFDDAGMQFAEGAVALPTDLEDVYRWRFARSFLPQLTIVGAPRHPEYIPDVETEDRIALRDIDPQSTFKTDLEVLAKRFRPVIVEPDWDRTDDRKREEPKTTQSVPESPAPAPAAPLKKASLDPLSRRRLLRGS